MPVVLKYNSAAYCLHIGDKITIYNRSKAVKTGLRSIQFAKASPKHNNLTENYSNGVNLQWQNPALTPSWLINNTRGPELVPIPLTHLSLTYIA